MGRSFFFQNSIRYTHVYVCNRNRTMIVFRNALKKKTTEVVQSIRTFQDKIMSRKMYLRNDIVFFVIVVVVFVKSTLHLRTIT